MKRIAILGSTGSIGKNALKVISRFPDEFKVEALSTNSNSLLLEEQIRDFHPAAVCVNDFSKAVGLKGKKIKVFSGESGLCEMARDRRVDLILLAISGSAALAPLLSAIEAGCDIALANKEALVMAGPIIMERAKRKKVKIIPVDSEQSAIWQCLDKQAGGELKNIYLTASGGPLRQVRKSGLKKISLKQVLRHPRWKMGRKITVDSATLMNKGLEVLEAMYLFKTDINKIRVVIHPEAIIHSMVEFIDGVVLAQLSVTDMRIPIQYALTYPKRLSSGMAGIDFFKLASLNFEKPDFAKFPCLELAYQAAREQGTAPCVMNSANEVCVESFLKCGLQFAAIPLVIEKVLAKHKLIRSPGLQDIFQADLWARREAGRIISRMG